MGGYAVSEETADELFRRFEEYMDEQRRQIEEQEHEWAEEEGEVASEPVSTYRGRAGWQWSGRLDAHDAYLRRVTPPGAERMARLVAEHEAAHAVVAAELGLGVGRVVVRADGSGYTEFRRESGVMDRRERAAVVAAAAVWVEHVRGEFFPEGDTGGCAHDVAQLRARRDAFGVQDAARMAHQVLRRNGNKVLRLAEALLDKGSVDYDRWSRGL